MDNLRSKLMPIEQSRWNQSNIDSLFYAGNQSLINGNFNFSPGITAQSYYFNLVQQPINMVTGYQRQHRKSIMYQSREGADNQTTDQYTKLITNVCNSGNIHETFSKSCEFSAIAGLNLLMPYLDYTGEDAAQGDLKLKVWEYNSFLVDPYFRQPDMSDASVVWCQEFITDQEAESRFGDRAKQASPMMGSSQAGNTFYFLPENYHMTQSYLRVVSYIWYKWKRKKKRLYSKTRNQFFDYAGDDGHLDEILYHIPDMQPVTIEVPTWKLATVLNDQLMYQGLNPLGFDSCPFIPMFWNYDPHVNQPELRSRSLIFPMRSPQFLFNHKVITNNDIAAATINAGWKRKVGAVANEENLKRSGQGWDVIINQDYELTDCEKIIPSAVPESDLALAQQMADLIQATSGINLENWAGQQDKQISSLTQFMKMAANLMVFQKYFDQWDYGLRLLGDKLLQIGLNNWNASKVGLMIGEEPSPYFFSKIFAKYQVQVEESDLTPTQQNLQAQQMMDINTAFQREVFPPSMIIPKLNITGKGEIIPFLQQQEQQAQQLQQEQTSIQHAFEDAKLKELYTKAAGNLATARERHGRAEADIGLFEERLSEITQNRAMATKAKMEALEKLVDVIAKYGEIEAALKMNQLENIEKKQERNEDREKIDAKQTSLANEFTNSILKGNQQSPGMAQDQQESLEMAQTM